MTWNKDRDGMLRTERDGEVWCIDTHQKRYIVWCGTQVVGRYLKLSTAKNAVALGLKVVAGEFSDE